MNQRHLSNLLDAAKGTNARVVVECSNREGTVSRLEIPSELVGPFMQGLEAMSTAPDDTIEQPTSSTEE